MDINFLVINKKMKRLWEGQFSKKDRVLDVGCGDYPNYHRYLPPSVVCADKNSSKKAQVLSDAQILPFKNSSFDGVVCVNALYYCEKPREAIEEFSRILKKNGKMVLITPFFYPIHDVPYDKYRFTESGLLEIIGNGFSIEKIIPVGGLFSVPALILHSIQKGCVGLFSKKLRPIVNVVISIILLPLTLLGQIMSLLDVFDRSKRFPIYYFTVARKK